MTTPTPDLAAARDVLEQMRESDAAWQHTLSTFTDPDGDIDPEHHAAYESAKIDHGWDLVTDLTDWVTRLTNALTPGQPR
jgi:hypothetical protein